MSPRHLLCLALVCAGCATEYPAFPEDCAIGELALRVRLPAPEALHILVVLDTTPSTKDEDERAMQQLAALRSVSITLDRDGDGIADYAPAEVRFEVIESDRHLVDAALAAIDALSAEDRPRPRSVIVITDGDDESSGTPAEIAEAFAAHRADTDWLNFAVIGGVPPCTSSSSTEQPARLLSIVAALSARGVRSDALSFCSDDWRPALDPLLRPEPQSPFWCLPVPVTRLPDESANCVLYETASPSTPCEDVPGRVRSGSSARPDHTCIIEQVDASDAPTSVGWYLTSGVCHDAEDGDALAFTSGAGPRPGSQIELRCGVYRADAMRCE